MKFIIQDIPMVEQAKEIAGMGENSDVTTIGVMGVLCLILLGFTIAIWRAKQAKEKEQKELNDSTLEALTTANIIIQNLDIKVKENGDKITQLNMLLNSVIGKLEK